VVGLALKISVGGRFWSMDAIEELRAYEDDAIADAIERSSPETADCFQYRVLHLPD
jgi:hypothetical protein